MGVRTAYVLGGGGVLGASQVGMVRALAEAGVRPDLVVGTSIGAVNGAFIAADPSVEGAERLTEVWQEVVREGVLWERPVRKAAKIARNPTHLLTHAPLATLLDRYLPVTEFGDLTVPFQCVAAQIEESRAVWFDAGPIRPAVLASCSVPGLFPPVEIAGKHYFDGGLVHSIPVGRAVALGAREIYVLQVGRVEQQLSVPRAPWDVASVAFESPAATGMSRRSPTCRIPLRCTCFRAAQPPPRRCRWPRRGGPRWRRGSTRPMVRPRHISPATGRGEARWACGESSRRR